MLVMCTSAADLSLAFVWATTSAQIACFRSALNRRPLTLRNLTNLLMFRLGCVQFTQPQWNSWRADIAAALPRVLMRERGEPLINYEGDIHTVLSEVPLSQIIGGGAPSDRSMTFRRLIIAVSAEAPYTLRATSVAVGCADHCFGYWPTDRPRQEGEYEGSRYFSDFGMNGLLKPVWPRSSQMRSHSSRSHPKCARLSTRMSVIDRSRLDR
jgi:hypothetical protein